MRRTVPTFALSALALSALLGGLVAVSSPAMAAAADLPDNCQRDGDNPAEVTCTWTSGTGNRFVVPAGVTSVSMVAIGAPGGSTRRFDDISTVPGGRGGVGTATTDLPAGTTDRVLLVDVGTPGGDGADATPGATSGRGGLPGGGSAGANGFIASCGAGGGGGYSTVRRRAAGPGVDTRLVVGGGGGGSTGCGAGRAAFGADAGFSANRALGGGGAGTTTAGGVGGIATDPADTGQRGRLFFGGSSPATGNEPGGGGGGGLYGGGSGASAGNTSGPPGAGGGGSSTGGSRLVSGGPAVVTISFALPVT